MQLTTKTSQRHDLINNAARSRKTTRGDRTGGRLSERKEYGNEWKNRPDQRADQRGRGCATDPAARPGEERALLPTNGETLHDHIQSISRRNDQSSGQRIAGNGGRISGRWV